MIIKSIEPIVLRIPFTDGSPGEGIFPTKWTALEIVLVRAETDDGLVGWGESFGYFCAEAVAAMIRRNIAPLVVGRNVEDLPALALEIQRRMVLPGRYGLSIFALSGVDMALWDVRAKRKDVSLAELLGGRKREAVPAYASFVRYGEPESLSRVCERARDEGYRAVKPHEITLPEIRTVRERMGPDAEIMVDVNCNWSEAFAREAIPELKELNALWLEEPVFPPEDFATLARLRELGLPIAVGENACTAVQFAEMIRAGAADYFQPSITKVGGVTEFRHVMAMAREAGVRLMPHSPYFGPGYLATLQCMAAMEEEALFEFLYVDPEAWLYRDMPLPKQGVVCIPDGPGLGLDPDAEKIERYQCNLY